MLDDEERITQVREAPEDGGTDGLSLRPKRLDDFIGQSTVKENLKVFIEAAKLRGEPLDHVLFYGPPGLGKTTLAGIIAEEMGTRLKVTSGPAIERPGELAAILSGLSEGDVLFVDEIHRLNRQVEEVLYPAMEDYAIDIILGKGANPSMSQYTRCFAHLHRRAMPHTSGYSPVYTCGSYYKGRAFICASA